MNFADMYYQTFITFKKNALQIILASALALLPIYLMSLAGGFGKILMLLTGGYLIYCLSAYLLKIVREQNTNIASFFILDKLVILPSIIMGALLFLLSGLWSVILIIPGIFVFSMLSMCFHIMSEENLLDPLECFKRSYTLTKKKIWLIVIANAIIIILTVALIVIFIKLITLIMGAVWYITAAFHLGGYLLIQLLNLLVLVTALFSASFLLTMHARLYDELVKEVDISDFKDYETK